MRNEVWFDNVRCRSANRVGEENKAGPYAKFLLGLSAPASLVWAAQAHRLQNVAKQAKSNGRPTD